MAASNLTREVSGSRVTYAFVDVFDNAAAWELTARLAAERLPEVVVDFSRVAGFADHGIAVLAAAIQPREGRRIQLRGLREHQLRLLQYFGIDSPQAARGGGDHSSPPAAGDLRPAARLRIVGA